MADSLPKWVKDPRLWQVQKPEMWGRTSSDWGWRSTRFDDDARGSLVTLSEPAP